uniref:WGS project CAEQ00000000 data, annotated contig 644 n=1 Tax=Trypanosoma congolense (strain IL3000) TaxID=1068625 RepID=F9WHF9_TRYCI|nr:unnamed protein product [Trypanosoma congolense IL3000]
MWQRLFSRRGGSSRERSDVRSSSLNSEGARRTIVRRVFIVGSRLPYEDGPGVWGCTCEPRQPYSPKKEIKETPESCCSGRNTAAGYVKQGPEDALVVSPTRRRDAAIWFKSHGTLPQRKSIQRGASPRGKRTKGGGDASLPEGLVPSAVLDALKGIIRRGTPTARSGSRTRGSDAGTPQKKRNLSSSRKNACGGTPTYVEAFYKLDPQVAKRYGLIIASHEGPVLRNITPRTRGKCTAKTRGLPPRSTGDNFSCVRELSPISIPKERSNTPVRASFTVPHVLSTPGSKHHREK